MNDNLYYSFHEAVKYQRYLLRHGIESEICSAYSWQEQTETHRVVIKEAEA